MAGARMTTRLAPPLRRAGQAPRGHAGVPRGRASGSFLPLFLRARSKCLLSAAWPRGGISSTRSCLQRPTCLVCTLRWGGWPGCGPLSASVRLWTNPGATRGASVRQSASDATAVAVRFLAQCGPSRVFVVSGTFLRVLCSLVHLGPTPLVLCDLRGVLHPGGVCISALWGHGIAFKHRVAPYVSPVWLTYP